MHERFSEFHIEIIAKITAVIFLPFLMACSTSGNFATQASGVPIGSVPTPSPVPSTSARLSATSFTPPQAAASAAIPNPMSGFFSWLGNSAADWAPVTENESYNRFSWANLESSQGAYNFSLIDSELAALPKGGRLSFRVMAVNSCYSSNVSAP